jgi:gluconate 2-dehydrogenase gamma chain
MDEDNVVSRRSLLAGAVLIPVAAIQSSAQPAAVFAPTESKTLEAFIDRLVPSDENGPGAVECGAAAYIERCFGDHLAAEKPAFLAGLSAVDALARSKHGMAFADLAPAAKDEVLTAFESTSRASFNRVRQLTLEGMFSDPFYGGNREYRGWDLIRYPGPRLAVSAKEQVLRDPIKPVRMSGAGHAGETHGH